MGIGCNCSVVASRADGVRMFLAVVRDSASEAVASAETLQWLKAEVHQLQYQLAAICYAEFLPQ